MMATETAPVNGLYGTQYSQPAELAASTPSAPAHAPSASQSTTTSTTQKADPQEIGWYFVEQYYTTLSKSPEKIHLFYSKKSQLVTGVEAEKVIPAVGTKAISEKIKALDIQDCKVRVLNVDSQASFSNIVVQVIGEMSNKSEPHHKFVQTFVLAEQPNGYFVLNDIFRYLNEDEDEIVDDEEEPQQPEIPTEEPSTLADDAVQTQIAAEVTVTTEAAAEEVDDKLQESKQESVDTTPAEVNGAVAPPPAQESADESESAETTLKETLAPAAGQEQTFEPEVTRAQTSPPAETPAPVEAAPAKKTWASMVGGKAPAVPALPANPPTASASSKAARPAQAAPAPKAPAERASTPTSQSNGWQTADHNKKGNRPQNKAAADGITSAYIKNVNEKVDARILRAVLESFGELRWIDVSRAKNCAFVEFVDPAGYAAAAAANPHTVGSEQIYVEERRRPSTYGGSGASFGRSSSNAGRGRGGLQGRSGSQGGLPKDAGRGGFQQRGGKSGNVTPKGRGQAQAA